jgi:ribosomal protein L11 methyltransferase
LPPDGPVDSVIHDGSLWHVAVQVADAASAERAGAALGTLCDAVSTFECASGNGWLIEGFATGEPNRGELAAAFLAAWIDHGAPPEPTIERLPQRDWVRENQESFAPRRVGGFFIHGSHYRGAVPAGARELLIDAATAFGTGEHASTEGCLRALDELTRRRHYPRALDMGTGTGILAIAAAKSGVAQVLAVDIDGASVRAAATNFRRNRVASQVRSAWSAGYRSHSVRRHAPFDLVCANILARPLAAMARDLSAVLKPGGAAVLSGLLASQVPLVLAAHRRQRLFLCRRIAIEGWHTLILRRAALHAEGEGP